MQKFKFFTLAIITMLSVNLAWAEAVTIASWGAVSLPANTAVNASSYQGTTAPKMTSNKAMTSSGTNAYYGSSAGGATITISGLPSGYKITSVSFYTRASQGGSLAVSYTTDGSTWTDAGSGSCTSTVTQRTVSFTKTPTGVSSIKFAHSKTTGSLYFGTVVVTGEMATTRTITWMVNGEGYTAGNPTTSVSEGDKVTTLPTEPSIECGGKTFVGWTDHEVTDGNIPSPLFKTAANAPTVSGGNKTYYAVFANASGGGGGASGSVNVTYESENFPTAYGTANTFAEYTLEGYKFQIQQVYINGGKMQWRAAGNTNGTGTIYNNETFPNKIASVIVTWNTSDANKNHTLKKGNSANPTSGTEVTGVLSSDGTTTTFDCGGDCDYFVLTNGANAGYTNSITINYGSGASYSNYTTTCATCANLITITKGTATGGTYTLKAGSASGAEIADGGTVDNCDANATIVVVPNANSHYHCTGVTASNFTSVTGPDGGGNYTITYTQGSNISSTINVTFAEDTKVVVTLLNNNAPVEDSDLGFGADGKKEYYTGETLGALPTLTSDDACDAGSKHFMGWTSDAGFQKRAAPPSSFVSASTPATDGMILRAVWARAQ